MNRMNRQYKDSQLQLTYDLMIKHAQDSTSALYYNGYPRRGGSHRCDFWGGYYNNTRRPAADCIGRACFMAGRDFAEVNPNIADRSATTGAKA